MYLLTLFSNDPTTKLPIRNLLISIAIPTQLGARSDGRFPTSVGMIERPWLPPSECATLAILSILLYFVCFRAISYLLAAVRNVLQVGRPLVLGCWLAFAAGR